MSTMFLTTLLLTTLILTTSAASDCDSFLYDTLCPTDQLNNIIWAIPNLENEIKCQEECMETTGCKFFMFIQFVSGGSECFHLRSCDTESNSTSSCTDQLDCSLAVSGPVSPSLKDSCCEEFEDVSCEEQFVVGFEFAVFGEEACQHLCRDEILCNYWSLLGEVCFMYSECGTPEHCSSCSSGPAFPDMSTCKSHRVEHSLLLGGHIPGDSYSTTIEMLTPNLVCTPDMPALPVARFGAAAVLLDSKIFYCGGYNGDALPNYHGTCHSFLLGQESTRWEQEASMKFARSYFGLSVIGAKIYATGGYGDVIEATVESFSQEDGWKVEEEMTLSKYRYRHCSISVGTTLYVIGGRVGSSSPSTSVEAIDTANTTAGWVTMKSMDYARYGHSCQYGNFENLPGIYVTGGYTTSVIATVEFYELDTNMWRRLNDMSQPRYLHSLTIVNGNMVAAGGYNTITTVETFNETELSWSQTNNLKVGRNSHAAISFPAGLLSCRMN